MYMPSQTSRKWLLYRILGKVGTKAQCVMCVEIRSGRNISIGNNSVINARVLLDGRGWKLIIGVNVDIAQETSI